MIQTPARWDRWERHEVFARCPARGFAFKPGSQVHTGLTAWVLSLETSCCSSRGLSECVCRRGRAVAHSQVEPPEPTRVQTEDLALSISSLLKKGALCQLPCPKAASDTVLGELDCLRSPCHWGVTRLRVAGVQGLLSSSREELFPDPLCAMICARCLGV